MKYKVGQLVVNRKLGLGKVLEISGDEVTTFFKNEQVNPRTINVNVVPMEIAEDQSDPYFDDMSVAQIAKLKKPTTKARTVRKPRAAKPAAAVEEDED